MIQRDMVWFSDEDSLVFASLRDVALRFPELLPSFSCGMITALDGGRGAWVRDTFRSFRDTGAYGYPYENVGNTVVLSGSHLQEIIVADAFFGGFDDEVWLFDSAPHAAPPENLRLTSVASIRNRHHPHYVENQHRVARWMTASPCVLGLGDGHGLRFATPRRDLARLLAHGEIVPVPPVS